VLLDNPAHRRSRLVALTADGHAAITEMAQVERGLLAPVLATVTEPALAEARTTLHTIRRGLDELAPTQEKS
jgi:DNA-binding MarR family transcriptional regulator